MHPQLTKIAFTGSRVEIYILKLAMSRNAIVVEEKAIYFKSKTQAIKNFKAGYTFLKRENNYKEHLSISHNYIYYGSSKATLLKRLSQIKSLPLAK